MKRYAVNKSRSAGQFKRNIGRTKVANIKPGAMRGGIRL